MAYTACTIHVPDWIDSFVGGGTKTFSSGEDRMRFVLELARKNVEQETGGPFAAAIFNGETGALIAPGVNRVLSLQCCIAHAEVVAIMIAQKALGSYDLGAEGLPSCELVTSTEPCAMCLGAICWSGVRSLVCGAREADARKIGFDEGPKAADWQEQLQSRGIRVQRDVCRPDAAALLKHYVQEGGVIYNARRGA